MDRNTTEGIRHWLDGQERKEQGSNGWKVFCPAHADRQPNLSVQVAFDGAYRLKCLAGCPAPRILSAMGIGSPESERPGSDASDAAPARDGAASPAAHVRNVPVKDGGDAAVVVNLHSVAPRPVEWLWPGRVPLGKVTILSGDPNLGKSFLTLDLAARVSAGLPWPDGTGPAARGSVILLSAEDDVADTLVPRLVAAGADLSRVVAITGLSHGRRREAVCTHRGRAARDSAAGLAGAAHVPEQAGEQRGVAPP